MHDCGDHPAVPPVTFGDGSRLDPVTLQAFQALGRAFHLHRQAVHRRLSSPQTQHGEMIALRLLASSDGISQRELADTLHLSRPRITSILQALERQGAVRRQVDPIDQRITRVFLTAAGRRQEMENRAAFEDYVQRTIGKLSDTDKTELIRLLEEISGHIAALIGCGPLDSPSPEPEQKGEQGPASRTGRDGQVSLKREGRTP